MPYKLVFVDLDGTLLNEKSRMEEKNLAAIRAAAEAGIGVVVATGRPYFQAKRYSREAGAAAYVIASNGAFVTKAGSDEPLVKLTMTPESAERVIEFAYRSGSDPAIYTRDLIYVGGLKNIVLHWLYERRSGLKQEKHIVNVFRRSSWKKILETEKDDIHKCMIFEGKRKKWQALRDGLSKMNGIHTAFTSGFCFEVTREGVTKGAAVKAVADALGVRREEVVAIGDSENDLTMIEYAGLGVAMGNAEENLKRVAGYVAPRNTEHGVARVIYDIVLNGSVAG